MIDEIGLPGRLQAYFREAARKSYEAISIPPFTAFFHPSDPEPFLSYAIPDDGSLPTGDLEAPLQRFVTLCGERRRTPRFEYVEAFAPELGDALAAFGFTAQARPVLMAVTPETFREPAAVAGLQIEILRSDADLEDVRGFLSVQRRAFGAPPNALVSDADTTWQRGLFGEGRGFVARLSGEVVGGGVSLAPFDSLTEVAGVGTLEAHRRKGIGAAVTATAVRDAFARGLSAVILSAADERAGRVYESVGFAPAGHVCMYVRPATVY